MKITCKVCNKELSKGKQLYHIKTYHNNLTQCEKSILYDSYLAKPILYFRKQIIEYLFNNNIVFTFKEFKNYYVEKRFVYHINNFFTTKSKFKPIDLKDIEIFFNYYVPFRKKHKSDTKSKNYAIILCGGNEEEGKKFYQKIFKANNPFLGHGGELSPFSKDYVGYKNLTEEEKRIEVLKHNNSKLNSNFNNKHRIEYYLAKEMTEQQAKQAVSNSQKTFSLQKCIQKYGQEEGLFRFKQRQQKWLNNFPKKNYSNVSQELFWSIYEKINYKNCFFATNNNGIKEQNIHKNHQFKAETKSNIFLLDFYIPEIKCWIQFDGDYWHGQKRGNQKKDKQRQNLIKQSIENIHLKRVKERDFKNNPQQVINECIEWINSIQR